MAGRPLTPGDLESAARAAATGDRDAFTALCTAVQADVWRYCWAILGQRHLADHAAQQTLDRMARSVRRYHGDVPIKVWICQYARRACLGPRRPSRAAAIPVDEVEPSASVPAPRDTADAMTLLELLDGDRRQAFVLTQLVGLTYSDAARVLETSAETIRSQVYQARDQLAVAWLKHSPASDQSSTLTKRPRGTR